MNNDFCGQGYSYEGTKLTQLTGKQRRVLNKVRKKKVNWLAPFSFNKVTKNMDRRQKALAVLYFPVIIIMGYGYYARSKNANS